MLKPAFSTSAGVLCRGSVGNVQQLVWTADVEVLSECG